MKQILTEQPINRYLGLSLGGPKSNRTTLTIIDYYKRHKKSFVLEILDSLGSDEESTADQVLLQLIDEASHELSEKKEANVKVMAVDAPLTLPPCLVSCDSKCRDFKKCKKPEVRWMEQYYKKILKKNKHLKYFTPYIQRPVDIYFRYQFPNENVFQDDTLGSNLAPQAARMSFLKNHLKEVPLIETWPKLVLFYLHKELHLSKKEVLSYRHVEEGSKYREKILLILLERSGVFLYDRDLKKVVSSVSAFDSFLCAWTAMQYDLGQIIEFKQPLPIDSGWIQIPKL